MINKMTDKTQATTSDGNKSATLVGMNPTVLISGKSEGHNGVSHYGRRDLKA